MADAHDEYSLGKTWVFVVPIVFLLNLHKWLEEQTI